MIKYLFLIPIIFLHNIILSQENLLTEIEFPVFPVCKLVPVKNQSICFDQSISEHIEKYFVFPENARELGLQSVVNVSFIIDIDGKVNNITATSSLVGVEFNDKSALLVANKIFEDAASEIIKKLPIMQPAKVNGEFVSFPLKVPIVYRLNSNKINFHNFFESILENEENYTLISHSIGTVIASFFPKNKIKFSYEICPIKNSVKNNKKKFIREINSLTNFSEEEIRNILGKATVFLSNNFKIENKLSNKKLYVPRSDSFFDYSFA